MPDNQTVLQLLGRCVRIGDRRKNMDTDLTLTEERQWVQLVRSGDGEAFANLVERYHRPVYNLCYRMLGNPNDAEDAAQEAFLRAFKSIKRYDPSRKFSTWVLSIASHYCIDQIRKRRYTLISLDGLPYLEISDQKPGPEYRAMENERQQQVQKMLASLSEVDRAAVIMRYWHDFSYDEIAETLNLTNSAVKSRLHRARQSLSEAWDASHENQNAVERTSYGTESYRIRERV